MNRKKTVPLYAETETDRAMRVLSQGASSASAEEPIEPVVPIKALEELLKMETPIDKKMELLATLIKNAYANVDTRKLEHVIKKQQAELAELRSRGLSHGQRPSSAHVSDDIDPSRLLARRRQPSGFVISAEDVPNHPMSRSSRYVRMLLCFFALYFCSQPFFIFLTTDTVVMSLMLFVITLLFAGIISRQYWETSEQELRSSLPEPEIAEQPREPKLNYSMAMFGVALFVQLVFALYSARAEVTTLVVGGVTAVTIIFLVLAFCFMIGFENAHELRE